MSKKNQQIRSCSQDFYRETINSSCISSHNLINRGEANGTSFALNLSFCYRTNKIKKFCQINAHTNSLHQTEKYIQREIEH